MHDQLYDDKQNKLKKSKRDKIDNKVGWNLRSKKGNHKN